MTTVNRAKSDSIYPYQRTFVEPTADAAWAKRLGLPYDSTLLITNTDGSVRLSPKIESEIPVDTTFLKDRIHRNQEALDYYNNNGIGAHEQRRAIRLGMKYDTAALEALRHTYKTGEPVVINENSHVSRNWIKDGVTEIGITPLSLMQNFTVRYNKDKKEMEYNDTYDFNQFEDFVPGTPFNIRGSIKLGK